MKTETLCRYLVAAMLVLSLSACSRAQIDSSGAAMTLENSQWRVVLLLDEPIPEQQYPVRSPELAFLAEGRVAGSDSCNRLMGGYQLEGQQLRFTQMASTLMACVDGMELADRFNRLIGEVRSYQFEGDRLLLLDEGERRLMQLERVGAGD